MPKTTRTTITPMAYYPKPGLETTLHFVGFPEEWKNILLQLSKITDSNFQDHYFLKTGALEKILIVWLDGTVKISPLSCTSDDKQWLTACQTIDYTLLCHLLKVWITVTYSNKNTPAVKELIDTLFNKIQPQTLEILTSSEQTLLIDENGLATDAAYKTLPLIVAHRLAGETIPLNGTFIKLLLSTNNELVSQKIDDGHGHYFSYVFKFSLQTQPPERKAAILLHMSIRRWLDRSVSNKKDIRNANALPYLKEAIHVHAIVDNRIYKIPIKYFKGDLRWDESAQQCYDLLGFDCLPEASEFLLNPGAFRENLLAPYKNGMNYYDRHPVGIGVSIVDKAAFYYIFHEKYLSDLALTAPSSHPLRAANIPTLSVDDYLKKYGCIQFRKWVKSCTEAETIYIEIYGGEADDALKESLAVRLRQIFGPQALSVQPAIMIDLLPINDFTLPLPSHHTKEKIKRCIEISEKLPPIKGPTACLILLDGENAFQKSNSGDPKDAIRAAFAKTGRLTQFITPDSYRRDNNVKIIKDAETRQNALESERTQAINKAIFDLLRQLGVVWLPDHDKLAKHPLAHTPCLGIAAINLLAGRKMQGKAHPIFLYLNLISGKIIVSCSAFARSNISYREACLQVAALYWAKSSGKNQTNHQGFSIKNTMFTLKNLYQTPDDPLLVLVQTDCMRPLWPGISDKSIASYEYGGNNFMPQAINAGTNTNDYFMTLLESGIRIIRIRNNTEIPDYLTSKEDKTYCSASGIHQYGNIYYGLAAKPFEKAYNRSFRESKLQFPTHEHKAKNIIELYPLQLQKDDDPLTWIRFANAQRDLPIQYDQQINLPLPLHLIKCLKEYIFEP